MNISLKKAALTAVATIMMAGGVSGVAIAQNKASGQGQADGPMVPRHIQRMLGDVPLTDEQKQQIEAIQVQRRALREQFWSVLTDEQKNQLLDKMASRRHHPMKGDRPFGDRAKRNKDCPRDGSGQGRQGR